jgi:hypothetical protein
MQLTEHFSDAELGVAGCDARLIANADFLCVSILEAVRAKFGPVDVHDGYRDPGHNARVGGKPTSYHMFEDGKAAADFNVTSVSNQALFDWMRLESGLLFDKLILERNPITGIAACVHVQVDRLNKARRLAYTGSTGNGKVYTPAEVK